MGIALAKSDIFKQHNKIVVLFGGIDLDSLTQMEIYTFKA
jgi:hypothetical protein